MSLWILIVIYLEKVLTYPPHLCFCSLSLWCFLLNYAAKNIIVNTIIIYCLLVGYIIFSWDYTSKYLFLLARPLKTDQSNNSIEIILMIQWVYWTVSKGGKGEVIYRWIPESPYSDPHNEGWHHKGCVTEFCLQLASHLLPTPVPHIWNSVAGGRKACNPRWETPSTDK